MRAVNFANFVKFLEDLAEQKGIDAQDLKDKMAGCGMPGTSGNVCIRPLREKCYLFIDVISSSRRNRRQPGNKLCFKILLEFL